MPAGGPRLFSATSALRLHVTGAQETGGKDTPDGTGRKSVNPSPMNQRFYRRILYGWLGFIVMAPHTSNWDFIIGNLYSRAEGFRCNFLIKREWFFWPMGKLMRRMGGIPVYRDKQMGTTDRLALLARKSRTFHLCITPEGTRKPNSEWKLGFYYIALKAGLPILLYGLDYRERKIECTKTIIPNGDVEGQMAEIKGYFARFVARKPVGIAVGVQ